MAILLESFDILAQVDAAGNLTVLVNGRAFDTDEPANFSLKHGTEVSYEPYRPGHGNAIIVQTGVFNLTVVAVKSFTDTESGYNRGHFDNYFELKGRPGPMDGILGSTFGRSQAHTMLPDDHTATSEANFEVPTLGSRILQAKLLTGDGLEQARRRLQGTDFPKRYPITAGIWLK